MIVIVAITMSRGYTHSITVCSVGRVWSQIEFCLTQFVLIVNRIDLEQAHGESGVSCCWANVLCVAL